MSQSKLTNQGTSILLSFFVRSLLCQLAPGCKKAEHEYARPETRNQKSKRLPNLLQMRIQTRLCDVDWIELGAGDGNRGDCRAVVAEPASPASVAGCAPESNVAISSDHEQRTEVRIAHAALHIVQAVEGRFEFFVGIALEVVVELKVYGSGHTFGMVEERGEDLLAKLARIGGVEDEVLEAGNLLLRDHRAPLLL